MRFIAWISFVLVSPAWSVTVDQFQCHFEYENQSRQIYRSSSTFWVIRYPGSCERTSIPNLYQLSYGSSDFSMFLEGGRVEIRFSLNYKHAVDTSGLQAAQWLCLNATARAEKSGSHVTMKNVCQSHGSDPFSAEDKQWVPVSVEKGLAQFAPEVLSEPVVIYSGELGSELRVRCEYRGTQSKK